MAPRVLACAAIPIAVLFFVVHVSLVTGSYCRAALKECVEATFSHAPEAASRLVTADPSTGGHALDVTRRDLKIVRSLLFVSSAGDESPAPCGLAEFETVPADGWLMALAILVWSLSDLGTEGPERRMRS